MGKPSLAIILEFGFHEIKKYIHSGFTSKLADHFDIVWFAIDKGNAEFDSYFKGTGFPLIYLNSIEFNKSKSKTEARNSVVRRNWMISNGLGAFHNYNKIEQKTIKSKILGCGILKHFYEYRTLRKIKTWYENQYIEEAFKINKIDHLLSTGYSSTFSKSAFVTAHKNGIKTWYLVNSWKDLYANNYVPFDFLQGIFVWSIQMKRDYLYHMPYLKPDILKVTGNPTFDALQKSKPSHPRSYYAQKYRISEKAEWLLYTMMPPGLVNDEIETVILLSNRLLVEYTPIEKVVIVRRNPNHSAEDFTTMTFPPNIAIAEHFCTYDRMRDMIIQSPEGEQEWIDLLHHCSINLSVPSTVTLEFLVLNKPVINIGFGPSGKPDDRLSQHFNAGFYRNLFTLPLVCKVNDINNLISNIKTLELVKSTLKTLSKANDNASDLVLKYMSENL